MRRLFILSVVGVLWTFSSAAQEVLSPLRQIVAQKQKQQGRIQNGLDTVQLPFIDDFSNSAVIPNPGRWTDRFVFVNSDMGDGPPTLGVATFDGLNAQGEAYDPLSINSNGMADRLTSQAINLGLETPADSVYLSFMFQPAGLCDPPESNDSLTLEWLNKNGVWQSVWGRTGTANRSFEQVILPVIDTSFLHRGFRMRWTSYGNLSGNVDVWHLDYVRLGRNRNLNDTLITDVGFRFRPSALIQPYQEMPWKQFAADSLRFKSINHVATARNLGAARNVAYKYSARNLNNGATIVDVGEQNISPFPSASDLPFTFQAFPIPQPASGDSLTLETVYSARTAPDFLSDNDTVRRVHRFWNHFAYDDGTAETGYGLNVIGGSVAYKFYVARPDTLRGMWMQFTQAANNASLELFNLKVWAFIGEGSFTGNESVLTQQALQRPRYADSIGQYVFYALDTPVVVRDSFYVGWQQLTQRLLNIGLDRNNNVPGVKWFNVQGQWNPSLINGMWMIRPVIGDSLRYPTATVNLTFPAIKLYPNPVENYLFVESHVDWMSYQLYDLQGRLLAEGSEMEQGIAVAWLKAGMYVLRLTDKQGRTNTARFIRK